MIRPTARLHAILASLIVAIASSVAFAGEWPAYRHDASRCGACDETLIFPMHEAWRYRASQAPRPAWPEPYHILNRLDFDYAPHAVTGGGLVYFGSTADDSVRALDSETGKQCWAFVTGGPVRFAPQFVDGKIYVGSDDGLVYCLDAANGKLIWQFTAAPYDDMFIGNSRMISRWPVRTGILVMDNTVYFASGMWNSDGIHVCALNAKTGAVIWRNDNTGFVSIFFKGTAITRTTPVASLPTNTTHEGEFGSTGITPQGALLAKDDYLFVPNGIAFPSRFSRRTGDYLPWETNTSPAPGVGGSWGGTWGCIDNGFFFTLAKYRQDILNLASLAIGTRGGVSRTGVRATLPQINVQPPGVGSKYRPADALHDKGKVSIVVYKGKAYSRHAYALALSGHTLLIGLDSQVVAEDADSEKELWRAPVEGIAREISIANDRVLVSTQTGTIHCFESGETPVAASIENPGTAIHSKPSDASPLIERLREAGADSGFALVFGDPDARLSLELAAATNLCVIDALTDETAVAPLRDRLINTTNVYGTRVHVLPITHADHLPFARYFANAVIVAGNVPGLSGSELYRVLHPFGGILLTPGLAAGEAAKLLHDAGAGTDELGKIAGELTRGPLAGARDWSSPLKSDKALAGPVRVLWFGGPDTDQTQSLRQSLNFPAIASGKYLTVSESLLTLVDAYNGSVRWSRQIPRKNRDLRDINGVVYYVSENAQTKQTDTANDSPSKDTRRLTAKVKGDGIPTADDSEMVSMDENEVTSGGRAVRIVNAERAYLVLGKEPDDIWIELDLRSGKQQRVLQSWTPAPLLSLQKPQKWKLDLDAANSGSVSIETAADGLVVTLSTKDPVITPLDTWELYFDFRPTAERCGLYEDGAFSLTVAPALSPGGVPTCTSENGPKQPAVEVSGGRDENGTHATLKLTWVELAKIAGTKPISFGFGATLNSFDRNPGGKICRGHIFSDWASDSINNGWANVFIGEAPASVDPPGIISSITAEVRKRYPDLERIIKAHPLGLDDTTAAGPRIHPLTGELEPKIYRPGTGGCGAPQYSATTRFGRATGNLGFYDFTDDSGLRNLSGIKAGCSTPITTALGLAIISPEGGHCVCTFPFATTVTLAPADRRLNEDWAIYNDRDADTVVRQAAINLGAIGDRRDEQGKLWLGFPRAPERAASFSFIAGQNTAAVIPGTWMHYMPASMQVPLSIEYIDPARSDKDGDDMLSYSAMWAAWTPNRLNKAFGPYRVNTDVVHIAGTSRPWLYGQGYRGLKRATMRLDFRKPLVATNAPAAPSIDGKLDEATWNGAAEGNLPFTKTAVFLRKDSYHLYIALRRAAVINRLGKTSPWTRKTAGEDAAIWDDDSCEVFLSDPSGKVVHLGVSASGARYDALATGTPSSPENAKWNGEWQSGAVGDATSLSFELAIPFKTLSDAGLKTDALAINVQLNQRDISGEVFMYPGASGRDPKSKDTSGEALSYLGHEGRSHCRNFVSLGLGSTPAVPSRLFTVRLHFAELDDVKPGQRVFDLKLQGRVVLKAFDIAQEAGLRTALVKEFEHVSGGDELTLEFTPGPGELTATNAPILSAFEFMEEEFSPADK